MKKPILLILIIINILAVSCNRKKTDNDYIRKAVLNEETIAVGIYKATGFEYPNIKYIAEALKIDGGIVYVTLTDADVLKTKLDNIDVVVFPKMNNDQKIDKFDDEIAKILNAFIVKKGKGAIAFGNGANILSTNSDYQSLDLVNIELINDSLAEINNGLVRFDLTEEGKQIFPGLKDYQSLFIEISDAQKLSIKDTSSNIQVLGKISGSEIPFPLFVTSTNEKGRIALVNASPETTPGMRWMIPRLVRWSVNKEFVWYSKNVFRPGLYHAEVVREDKKAEIEQLMAQLEQGKKDEVIMAMDELQNIYPWVAAERVRQLLVEKNNDIKLRAAKYLVDIEYTLALEDLNQVIQSERSRKVKEKLIAYRNEFEAMLEQN